MDEKPISVPPGSSTELTLDQGTHTLTIKSLSNPASDSAVSFQVEGELFIHAPGQRYLLWRDLYGGQQNRATLLNEQVFELDSVLYRVDVSWLDTSKIIHPRTWDFGIGESFDDEIVLRVDQNEGIRTRLLRKQDFKEEYQKRVSRK